MTATKRIDGVPEHPAKFSAPIMHAVVEELDRFRPPNLSVLDPFAGVGGVHALEAAGFATWGVELEPEWARAHERTQVGDATHLPLWWSGQWGAIVTSPPYGNRMADSYAGDAKGSRRHTYRIALGRELTAGSIAGEQWGMTYRNLMRAAILEMRRVLAPGGVLVLNVSDHVRAGELMPVTEWYSDHLGALGFKSLNQRTIATQRVRHGANAAARADGEALLVVRKPAVAR